MRSGFLSIGLLLVSLCVAVAQKPPVLSGEPVAPLSPSPAPAVDPVAEREAAQAKCWADLQVLCPNIENRQDRIRCIRQHRAKLPESCVAARRARGTPIREACAGDVKKLCADAPRGRAVLRCLLEKRPEVSEGCGAALDARPGGPGPVRNPKRGAALGPS